MRIDDATRDFIVNKLTELLIKNDFYEKKKQVDVYIKKSSAYKDLIRLVKKVITKEEL